MGACCDGVPGVSSGPLGFCVTIVGVRAEEQNEGKTVRNFELIFKSFFKAIIHFRNRKKDLQIIYRVYRR